MFKVLTLAVLQRAPVDSQQCFLS